MKRITGIISMGIAAILAFSCAPAPEGVREFTRLSFTPPATTAAGAPVTGPY